MRRQREDPAAKSTSRNKRTKCKSIMVLLIGKSTMVPSPSRRPTATSLQILLFLSSQTWPGGLLRGGGTARAAVPCDTTETCERLLRPGSECVDGACTNPFASGCLRRVAADAGVDLGKHSDLFRPTGGTPGLRVCNSDDPPDAADSGLCSAPSFDYTEIRIAPGNWESSMFAGWISQILLSEVMHVPTTIETGEGSSGGCSFYDIDNAFTYPSKVYNWEALQEAHGVVDCQKSTIEGKECAHVLPEVWAGQKKKWEEAQQEGYAEAPDGNDMIGHTGWYVPKFTIERDPSVGSIVGLKGEKNRRKLAKLFKRPTTWRNYCADVSTNGCAEPDGTAARPPDDDDEGGMFFKEGLYTGHFRYTERSNCTLHPKTCTGHMVEATCKYSTFTQSQIYWNDMALESGEGTLPPINSYSWSHRIQIMYAANATESDILFEWWTPDWLPQIFDGTHAEFHRVTLGNPSQKCAMARVNNEDRCSADKTVRVGKREGSCDYEANVLKKVISASLKPSIYDVPPAGRSGAYDLVKSMSVSDLAISEMLKSWRDIGLDTWGYDPREVVCTWVADNLDELRRHIPDGYPRVVSQDNQYKRKPHLVAAKVMGGLSTVAVLATAAAVWHYRKHRVMRNAQVNFLLLILFGFLLVSIAAIVYVLEPSDAYCVSKHWLTMLGFTFGMVPLVVKVYAINKIVRSSRRMRKVKLKQRDLYTAVGLVVLAVTVFLATWTALDPPSPQVEQVLNDDGYTVELRLECASDHGAWYIVAMCWQIILLVCATVLAFQARNVRQEFNESKNLAVMDYSHFMFAIFRAIIFFMSSGSGGEITPDVTACAISFLLSFDSLFALFIYFGPKIMMAVRNLPQTSGYTTNSMLGYTTNGSNISTRSLARFLGMRPSQRNLNSSLPTNTSNSSILRNSNSSLRKSGD